MMTVCPRCGTPGIGRERFCRVCGSQLQAANLPPYPPEGDEWPQYQPPYPQENAWQTPPQDGQPFMLPQDGQPFMPPQDGQPFMPPQDGQPFMPLQDGQPFMPPQDGQPFMPPHDGQPFMPPQGGMPFMPPQDGLPFMPPQDGQPFMLPQEEQPPVPQQDEAPQWPQQDEPPPVPQQDEQPQPSVQDEPPQPQRRTRRRQAGQQETGQPETGQPVDEQPQPVSPEPQTIPSQLQNVQPEPQPVPPQPEPAQPARPRINGPLFTPQLSRNAGSPDTSSSEDKKKQHRKILIIGMIILAVVLILLFVFLLSGKGKKDDTSAQSARPSSPPRKEIDFSGIKGDGDTVMFGYYEQDNNPDNGPEPIEWIAIEVWEGEKALLVSRYALDAKPYNTEPVDVTWDQCSLREWLNNDFLNAAFDRKEQDVIITKYQDAGYIWPGARSGDYTEDKIFLLTKSDIDAINIDVFTGDEGRMCAPTDYAIANGAWVSSEYQADGRRAGPWWLRNPGYYQNSAAFVDEDGSVRFYTVSQEKYAVRPAVWVSLEAPAPTPESRQTDTPDSLWP